MSNLVFPTLPGLKIEVDREPYFATQVQETISGRELRSTWWTYPRYRYRLAFEILNATKGDFQTLFGYLAKHFGALDSFLWTDPQDNAVTDHCFGLGDGITTAYQLQRTLAGSVTDASGATYTQATKPYTNLIFNSSFETDANGDGLADGWSIYNNSASTEPAYASIVPGLNGGKAQRISWGTPATNTKGVAITNVSAPPGPKFTAGQWYTVSVFARASGSNVGKYIGLAWSVPSPTTTIAIACPPLTTGWQRYVFQIFWNAGIAPNQTVYFSISNLNTGSNVNTPGPPPPGATSTFGTLDFDLAQSTVGQWGANDLQPIETPAAATATDNPQLWPAITDGFEPIFDLAAPPTIYLDGDWQGRRALSPFPRTNLNPQSETLTAWGGVNRTVTADSIVAPDGTATADTFNEGVPPNPPTLNTVTPSTTGGTLAAGTYYVKVASINSVNASEESIASAELSATTTGATGSIAVTWTAPTTGPAATGFRVYVGTSAGGEGQYFAVTPGTATSFTITTATGTAATPRADTNVQHYAAQNLSSTEVAGELRCYSTFVKANTLPNILWGVTVNSDGVNFNLSTGVIDSITSAAVVASGVIPYPSGWYRIWFTRRASASLAATTFIAGRTAAYGSLYTGTGRSCYAWGAMCERVADLNGPTPYIKTPSTVAVTVPAEYSVGSTGIVTLTTAPAAGTWLTWDGSYYRRVRFAQDNLSASRLASAMWAAKAVELVSVK